MLRRTQYHFYGILTKIAYSESNHEEILDKPKLREIEAILEIKGN